MDTLPNLVIGALTPFIMAIGVYLLGFAVLREIRR